MTRSDLLVAPAIPAAALRPEVPVDGGLNCLSATTEMRSVLVGRGQPMNGPSIPGYESLMLIGKGGFSRVYRAEQAKLKRQVAVKVLNFGLNDEADRRSFERETELMGRVSTHPNIVTVHDTAFSEQGQPCIVMEYYPGGSLADLISELGTLSAREVLEVGVAIASALDASHHAGVLHCDLKPQNILISEFGQPALGDFGISTFTEERTRTGPDSGAGFTLPYAAPEIIEGESPSVGTDVYSLAATLYTSLAGRRPFSVSTPNEAKPSAAEQARRILLQDVASLVDEGVPVELDHVICRAMAKDRASRPESAASFATELYEVGQRLGFKTAPPRTADRASLRSLEASEIAVTPAIDMTRVFTSPHAGATAPVVDDLPAAIDGPEAVAAPEVVVAPLLDDLTAVRAEPMDQSSPSAATAVATTNELRSSPAPQSDVAQPDVAVWSEVSQTEVAPRSEVSQPEVAQPQVASRSEVDAAVPGEWPITGSRKPSRSVLSGLFALASLAAVIVLLMFINRDGTDTGTTEASKPDSAAASAVDIVFAPDPPTNVEAQRLGGSSALIRWDTPQRVTDGPNDEVVYEVREQGGDSVELAAVVGSSAIIRNLSADETVCVIVLATRGNRVSSATDPACVAPVGSTFIEMAPSECAELPCDVRLALTNFAAAEPISVRVYDADFTAVDTDLAQYEPSSTSDSAGLAVDWTMTFGPDAEPGPYVVMVANEAGDNFGALVIIDDPAN